MAAASVASKFGGNGEEVPALGPQSRCQPSSGARMAPSASAGRTSTRTNVATWRDPRVDDRQQFGCRATRVAILWHRRRIRVLGRIYRETESGRRRASDGKRPDFFHRLGDVERRAHGLISIRW